MSMYPVFDRLRSLDEPVPKPPQLPTEQQVRETEAALGVTFPPSYREYQLHYSNVTFGTFDLYWLHQEGSYLDLLEGVREAREDMELPEHLLPFLQDDGDYYCFDLSSPGPEYKVVLWSHDGTTDESWRDFPTWVEACWIGENLESDEPASDDPEPEPKKPWWRFGR